MKDFKTFAVISLGWLGDTLLNSELCQDIKKNYPDSKIYFIASEPFKEVAQGIPCVDEAFGYDKKSKHKGLFGVNKFAKEFPHKNKIDCAFITHAHERSVMLAKAIGAKTRIAAPLKGFSPINLLITKKFKYTQEEIHTTYKGHFNSDYLKCINAKSRLSNVVFNVDEKYSKIIREKLAQNGLSESSNYIVLSPTSKEIRKDWTYDNIKEFMEKSSIPVVLVGVGAAFELGQKLKDDEVNFIDLTNQTTIFELAALMKHSKAVVSVDTGTMHVAYAVGAQTVCVFFDDVMVKEWLPVDYPNCKLILGKKYYKSGTKEVVIEKDVNANEVLSAIGELIGDECCAI